MADWIEPRVDPAQSIAVGSTQLSSGIAHERLEPSADLDVALDDRLHVERLRHAQRALLLERREPAAPPQHAGRNVSARLRAAYAPFFA